MKHPIFKRSLALVLVLLMLVPLFAACKNNTPATLDIVADGASEYTIFYTGDSTNEVEREAAIRLFNAIKESTGVTLNRKEDSTSKNPAATAKEIVVGSTNRQESKDAIASIRAKDFTIFYQNERVIITGGSPAATARAVEYFIANHVKAADKKVTVFEDTPYTDKFAYPLGDLSISGVSLKEYQIVYPKDADRTTYYMAVNLADYLLDNAGVDLKVVADSAPATQYELLVGNTSRTEDDAAAAMTLTNTQYILCTSGTKVVMIGNSYMVGGAASELVNTHFKSQGDNVAVNATSIPSSPVAKEFTFQKATSAILLIGDGMGENHIKWAENDGKIDSFAAYALPYQSKATTISQSVINGEQRPESSTGETGATYTFTDSAAAATALATGYKTINGYLGMDASQISRMNVRELAQSKGARTAILTNDVITGATPSGFLCHQNNRTDSKSLQSQIDALEEEGKVDYLCGIGSQDEIMDETREALALVSEKGSSFFVMIEEAHIDKRSHYAEKNSMQDAVKRYNDVIAYAIGFVMLHPTTALIVTADHETGRLTPDGNGSYTWESYDRMSGDDKYYEHTDLQVPVFGLGDGVETLLGNAEIDNTDIPKFIASIFGESSFGA